MGEESTQSCVINKLSNILAQAWILHLKVSTEAPGANMEDSVSTEQVGVWVPPPTSLRAPLPLSAVHLGLSCKIYLKVEMFEGH